MPTRQIGAGARRADRRKRDAIRRWMENAGAGRRSRQHRRRARRSAPHGSGLADDETEEVASAAEICEPRIGAARNAPTLADALTQLPPTGTRSRMRATRSAAIVLRGRDALEEPTRRIAFFLNDRQDASRKARSRRFGAASRASAPALKESSPRRRSGCSRSLERLTLVRAYAATEALLDRRRRHPRRLSARRSGAPVRSTSPT